MIRLTLTLSSVYLAVVGLELLFVPLQFGVGPFPLTLRQNSSLCSGFWEGRF